MKEKYIIDVDNQNAQKNIKNFTHFLCLFIPVICAFAGYFCAGLLWKLLKTEKSAPELLKFLFSIVFFIIPSLIIFIKTRSTNLVLKFRAPEKSKKL